MIHNSTVEIPAQDLKIGMYVSKLDRSWIGTSYPLQGALMRSQKDIDALRDYCRFVFVDIERNEPFVVQRHLPFAVSNVTAVSEQDDRSKVDSRARSLSNLSNSRRSRGIINAKTHRNKTQCG